MTYKSPLLRPGETIAPTFTPVPMLRNPHDGWTPERQQQFVMALAVVGSVDAAARMIRISRKSAYQLRSREPARSFAWAWDVAVASGCLAATREGNKGDRNTPFDGMLCCFKGAPLWISGALRSWKPAIAPPFRQRGDATIATCLLEPGRQSAQIAVMLLETETTPNPATLKFMPGREVMPSGTRDFASPEEAEASPLAEALFSLGDVEGVFFGSSFVSVTAGPGTNWADLKPDVLGIMLDHFSANMPLFRPASAAGISVPSENDHQDDPADEDIIVQIKDLIETRIRPAVANDGGDIIYRGFDKGIVMLKMQGACAGCPSSTATLKHGIESLLKHYVPEVTEVRAI
jgi:Fe-S cluster biogenesis protein NfuA